MLKSMFKHDAELSFLGMRAKYCDARLDYYAEGTDVHGVTFTAKVRRCPKQDAC